MFSIDQFDRVIVLLLLLNFPQVKIATLILTFYHTCTTEWMCSLLLNLYNQISELLQADLQMFVQFKTFRSICSFSLYFLQQVLRRMCQIIFFFFLPFFTELHWLLLLSLLKLNFNSGLMKLYMVCSPSQLYMQLHFCFTWFIQDFDLLAALELFFDFQLCVALN